MENEGKEEPSRQCPRVCQNYPSANYPLVRDKSLHRGFCTSETRIWARILLNEFWTPEFRTRILGSNFLVLFFPEKRPPEKFTVEKFTSQNSPSKIQPRNRAEKFTLHLCRATWLTFGFSSKNFPGDQKKTHFRDVLCLSSNRLGKYGQKGLDPQVGRGVRQTLSSPWWKLVLVCFGTRLGVSLAAPKGVSNWMGFKMVIFLLNFEKSWHFGTRLFWYPYSDLF